MRIAFFGTPDFAVPSLAALLTPPHQIVVVISQPDRPRGRGQKVSASPVAAFAETAGLTMWRPERLRTPEFLEAFRALDVDLAVVAAYGRLLPETVLAVPRLGFINVHASLLPRWRGAAPIHRAVMAGDRETGVTIMRVVAALDAGPMLAAVSMPIGPDETSAELEQRLAEEGARLNAATVRRMSEGPVAETPQDERDVTYASRIEKADGRCDWARPATEVHNRIRGVQPWPLVSVYWRQRRIRLVRSQVETAGHAGAPVPGTVIRADAEGILVAAAPGLVRILAVQADGRPVMTVRDFLNGHRIAAGDQLTPDA